jgi:putative molybdopterin biosynthesis protein
MDTIRKIETYPELKILGDDRRLAILRLLMKSSATLSQLGGALGMSPARVRHHLKVLEQANFVELDHTRQVRGFVEKYYRATAQAFFVSQVVLPEPERRGTIFILGSHDPALELLADHFCQEPSMPDLVALPVGSLDGLIALRQGFCHLTGCHLFDPLVGEYNTPFVRHLFPGQPMHIVTLAYRQQGLLVAPGNPCQIQGLEDLVRQDITFINRKSGSGTRLWLDQQLKTLGLDSNQIQGYPREVSTHSQVAGAVRQGTANAGLAVFAAARKFALDFVPLFEERFDLVIPEQPYRSALLLPVLEYLHTAQFRQEVECLGGYNPQEIGNEIRLS